MTTGSKRSRFESAALFVALLGIPLSLTSPGATLSMALVGLYGLVDILRRGASDDARRVFRWMGPAYAIVLGVDLLNGGGWRNLISTGVNYLPLLALSPYVHALTILQVDRRATLSWIAAALLLAALWSSYFAFVLGVFRPEGPNLNPIPYSFLIAVWAVIALSHGLVDRRKLRVALPLVFIAAIPILISESKIALLCFGCGLLAVGAIWAAQTRRWKSFLGSIAVCALAGFAAYRIGALRRFAELQGTLDGFLRTGQLSDGSFGPRYEMSIAGWRAFWERPLLGYGLDERIAAVLAHVPENASIVRSLSHLHNDYITHLVSFGIFGVVFLLVVFVGLWRLGTQGADPATARATLAAMIMFALYMTSEVAFNMDPISGGMVVIFGMLIATRRTSPESASATAPR